MAPNRSGLASPARLKKEGIALGELEGEIEALRSDGSLPKFGDLIREMCPGISKRVKELVMFDPASIDTALA